MRARSSASSGGSRRPGAETRAGSGATLAIVGSRPHGPRDGAARTLRSVLSCGPPPFRAVARASRVTIGPRPSAPGMPRPTPRPAMQCRTALALALSWSRAATAHATSTSIPPANQPLTGPTAALENLAKAYRSMSVAGIDAMLTNDYLFHGMTDTLGLYTVGWPREQEMRTVRAMLEGVTRNGKVGVGMANGIHMGGHPSLHVFHVVRGDAAVLAPGQAPDPGRWYIRRWLEDVTGLRAALREQKGDCGQREPSTEPGAAAGIAGSASMPATLGIRALTSPACSALRVSCDLPGNEPARVEVYDVSGRLVNTRRVAVKAAGNVTVDAGAGAHLLPGVYWVRLGQAARRPSTRMVVVAR